MIRRLILFILLGMLPWVSIAQERVVVKDPEIQFSYTKPDGWEVRDNGYNYEILAPNAKDAYVSITYMEIPKGTAYVESLGEKPSFEEDFDFELHYVLAEETPGFDLIEKGKTKIDDTGALWAKYRSQVNGEDRINLFYMFEKLHQNFKITGTAPAAGFEVVYDDLVNIIKSVQAKKIN